ncbi:male-enhanced antigen 1 isoform X1 [Antennarius striatus]|uniref:male-enhanced antigen 1 isoform X1 n=1 Tax=Antennarius striatus TaxID=241820 RepID=UPI0035B3596F
MEAMGPERVLPNSEDELGEDERPSDGALPVWSGGEAEGEEEGEMELNGDEEEEEEENSGGYYYQPLNQEPGEEGEERGDEAPSHTEQLQQVQHRLEVSSARQQLTSHLLCHVTSSPSLRQVMGLHLPEAPPPDSDEEEDPEGAAAQRSHASIPMDADHVELVKRTMAAVAFPSLGVPSWAREISDDQWKDMVQNTLQSRQSAAALRLARRSNVTGP